MIEAQLKIWVSAAYHHVIQIRSDHIYSLAWRSLFHYLPKQIFGGSNQISQKQICSFTWKASEQELETFSAKHFCKIFGGSCFSVKTATDNTEGIDMAVMGFSFDPYIR